MRCVMSEYQAQIIIELLREIKRDLNTLVINQGR